MWNDKPNKKEHKDIDARWTNKNGETFYGYKNNEKDYRNNPLTEEQKASNIKKLKIRARVEYVFSAWSEIRFFLISSYIWG